MHSEIPTLGNLKIDSDSTELALTRSDPRQDYENEAIVQRNKLPPRTYFIPKTSISLNGAWAFQYTESPRLAVDPESESAMAKAIWDPIEVPGHWQLHREHGKLFPGAENGKFGRPQYTNFVYPFPLCPPFVPTQNPTGTYRRLFDVPSTWPKDSQIRLRFDGVDSAFHLWVNGKPVGYSQGSRNPAEFDITSFVKLDKPNTVVARVYQWSDGSYIEDQDMWWLSGIFRDVHLIAFPGTARIDDFFIKTLLDDEYRDATLNVTLDLHLERDVNVSISLTEIGDSKKKIASSKAKVTKSTSQISLSVPVKDPLKWTAETPNLYNINIKLSVKGIPSPIQTIHYKVGFRRVELKDGLICVNGRPLFIRGVNRHDHHPKLGRAVPLEFVRQDLLLMKTHNINAIRCSHYPSHPALAGLADELGFWVIDEADLECHGFGMANDAHKWTSDNPSWRVAYLDRMQRLIGRDKNHPSVIIWSLGNESFYGRNHAAMYNYAKSVDPGRLVHYADDGEAKTADMFSWMYMSIEQLEEVATKEGDDFQKPVILCEYAHSMGNAPGALKEYQETFRKFRRLQGGLIWEWANHGLLVDTEDGKEYYAYGGDFGDEPNDGNFVMDGLCFSDHTPGPGLIALKKAFEPIIARIEAKHLFVRNEYDFITLDHIEASYRVEKIGLTTEVVLSDTIKLPKIHSGQEAKIKFPCELINLANHDEYQLHVSFVLKEDTLWAKLGFEIAWCQELIRLSPSRIPRLITPNTERRPLETGRDGKLFIVSGPDFSVSFDHVKGQLFHWQKNGKTLLETGGSGAQHLPAMEFSVWRPTTDNELRTIDNYYRWYRLHLLKHEVRSFKTNQIKDGPLEVMVTEYIAPQVVAWGFKTKTTYSIYPNGNIKVHVKADTDDPEPNILPRVGLNLRVPLSLKNVTWHGLGPGESYPDKRLAQKVSIYQSAPKEMFTPYEYPQENGNHMDTRWVHIHNGDDAGFRASRVNLSHDPEEGMFHFTASPYSVTEIDAAKHPTDLGSSTAMHLRLDSEVSGVGSGACGPGIRDEYQVKLGCKEFEFLLEPICKDKSDEDTEWELVAA